MENDPLEILTAFYEYRGKEAVEKADEAELERRRQNDIIQRSAAGK